MEICPTSNVSAVQCGLPQFLKHIKLFNQLGSNMVVCCDDTLNFNTNHSMELFEFCKAINLYEKDKIKQMLIRNVDAIFLDDDEFKKQLKDEIQQRY